MFTLSRLVMGFLGGAVVKNLAISAGDSRDVGLTLGWEGRLEKEMATHSSILAWNITPINVPGINYLYMNEYANK